MNIEKLHSGIAWDETTETYAVALGGNVLGHFPTHLQALRALENGTGHALGSPSMYPGTRPRPYAGHRTPSAGGPEVESRRSSEGAQTARHWSDVTACKAGRVDPQETMGQARLWDNVHGWYLRAGLCARCASQIAWGHQIGWSRVHPPCETCLAIISTFPLEQVNGWRSVPKQDRTARESRIKATSEHEGHPHAPRPSEGIESTAHATVPGVLAPLAA